MRFRSCVVPFFSLLLFSLPEANAQDVSEGRNFFISRCIGCHAFTCNKEGPRLVVVAARTRLEAAGVDVEQLPAR